MRLLVTAVVLLALLGSGWAQDDSSRRQRFRKKLMERFDRDGDGQLSGTERAELREFLEKWQGRSQGHLEVAAPSLKGLYGQTAPKVAALSTDLLLHDETRGKDLAVRVSSPSGEGPYPVIVWSHGLFGSKDNYQPLVKHWVSHGYMVLQPTHSDSLKGRTDMPEARELVKDWASRPQDVALVLDALSTNSVLKGKADLSRVGVGGHSFGAHTTLLTCGAQPRSGPTMADPRPLAFVAVSPQGEGRIFGPESWQTLKRPLLVISGDNDRSPDGREPDWRRTAYDKSPSGEKYLFWIKDAYHGFGGISGATHRLSGPPNSDHQELVRSATLAFWDKYLKGDPDAAARVDSQAFTKMARGQAHWFQR